MLPIELKILLDQYIMETISKEDYQRLWETLQKPEYAEQWHELTASVWNNDNLHPIIDPQKEIVLDRLRTLIEDEKNIKSIPPSAHPIHFLKTAWFRYAAAIILVAGVATFFSVVTKQSKEQVLVSTYKHLQADIAPGGEKALLTLADGKQIVLDHAANGTVARQGNAQVVKLANGQLVYNLKGSAEGATMMNTMTTPKGGQYQLVLPDGTKVWLNAASSITYPAVFIDQKRNVSITGEAYFEVAKNKAKPFIVNIDGKSFVEVLGTSLNINSYNDEGNIKATLFEGSVRVSNNNKQTLLKPGEQATIITTEGISVKSDADLAQILAWKNGIFDFTGADLKTVMRQLERWYDIKVRYQSSMSNITFEGRMYRNVNLSDVLEALQEMGVKFKMEGKVLIVL